MRRLIRATLLGAIALIAFAACSHSSPPDTTTRPLASLSRSVVVTENGHLVHDGRCSCYVIHRTWSAGPPGAMAESSGIAVMCMSNSPFSVGTDNPAWRKEYGSAHEAIDAYLAANPEPTP